MQEVHVVYLSKDKVKAIRSKKKILKIKVFKFEKLFTKFEGY